MKAPTLLIAISLCLGLQTAVFQDAVMAADERPPEAGAERPVGDGVMVADPAASAATAGAPNDKPLPDPVDELGPALAKKLQELESHFFGHLYVTEPVEKRIVRLERFVFGTESGGPFLTRIEHIASSLNLTDPDGTKREVKLRPKEQPKAQAQLPTPVQDQPNAEASAENATPAGEAPAPQLSELTKIPIVAPKPPEAAEEHVVAPQMEVAPVIAGSPRKTAEISTASTEERPHGALLQVSKEFFTTVGKPSEIIKELDMAIRVHPNDPELMYERGKAYIQLDKYTAAVNDLSDAIMNQPNKSAYYVARAFCYKKLGNSYLAADDVKQAHFVDPGLPKQVDFVLSGKVPSAASAAP